MVNLSQFSVPIKKNWYVETLYQDAQDPNADLDEYEALLEEQLLEWGLLAILQSVYYSKNILSEESALLTNNQVVVSISTAYIAEGLSMHLRQFYLQYYYCFVQK